jgi:hypothetical protein
LHRTVCCAARRFELFDAPLVLDMIGGLKEQEVARRVRADVKAARLGPGY